MRAKAVFVVFGRRLASGKTVFYYQCYDDKGRRQFAKSTGCVRKTEAVRYCMELYKQGLLIPARKMPTFAEFTEGFWDEGASRYLKWRELHDPLTKGTIAIHRNNFKLYIGGYFGKYRLDEIEPHILEDWFLDMTKKGLKPSTINLVFKSLRLVMNEAVNQKLISESPCAKVKELKLNETERDIPTVEEVRKLFPPDWERIWESMAVYKIHRLAACTGLRIGEARGLRAENIFDDYIYVRGQYTRYGFSPNTKTKHNRNVPITPLMRSELEELMRINGEGYIFSENGGESPVTAEKIARHYVLALKRIGINHEEKMKRQLSFHSWRHFFNTMLRLSDVADSKVQSVTGHRSMKMTDHYTHFDTRQFNEIRDVQETLLTDETGKDEKKRGNTTALVRVN
jgi:integrase